MNYKPTEINVAMIKVNAMDRSAGFHFSSSYLRNRFSQNKKTQGYGENNGDRNIYYHSTYLVNDHDQFDSNSLKIF